MPSEFSCLNLWHENEHGFAKDNFVIFACLSASIAAALRRRTNGVSGILCGKILFFPRFFQKSGRGLGQSPINPLFRLLVREYCSGSQPPYFEYAHIDKIEHLCYNIYGRETERPTSVNRQFLSPNEGKK